MNHFAIMRRKAGLLQGEVAEAMNVDRSTVSKWETDEAKPTVDKLIALARLYKCSLDDLVDSEEPQSEIE